MSKEGEKAAVFQTTKVRTKLRGDGSWLQRRSEPTDETTEEKPWIAEVRNSRLNGAPTSPVASPTEPTPPSPKPDTERAPTSGFLIRGIFTKLDKPASTSNYNGFSGVNQFNKKPSEVYKKIAPHTVRPTAENKEDQLSNEEQEKRKEAASNVLKKSSVRQRSYVLSAAKKFEPKEEPTDTPLVNSDLAFVAKRVQIADDDESATASQPASTLPAVPATSVSSTPQAKPRKKNDASVKTAVDVAVKEPVAPKVEEKKKEEVAPEPVKEDPPPAPVTEKDPFENMKPGCTKVATPLPELITECIQAVSTKPEPEDSDVSGQVDKPLVDLAPALPTPMSPTPASPAPASVVPESPAPVSLTPQSPAVEQPAPLPVTPLSPAVEQPAPLSVTPLSPATKQPAPVSLTPLSPATKQPAPVSLTPLSPATKQPAPVSLTPLSPAVKQPAPVSLTPLSPATKQPAPLSVTPLSPAAEQPAPLSVTPLSPAVEQPAPVSVTPLSPAVEQPAPVSVTPQSPAVEQPAPLSFTPVSAVTEILVKTEPEPEPEPEPKPSSSVDTLTALSDTLISFGPSSTSFKDDEPALAAEEGGSADGRTTESGAEQEPEQEPAPELSNCIPMTDDLLVLTNGPEAPVEPIPPPSPGRWSQDLLSGLDSESNPAKTSSTLDFLANDIVPINTEARSLSMQREEEEQTDETAKETQSPTETVTLPTKTVIITDKSEEDSADPYSSRVTTTVTESSSADPFDPYPIGTTSPNSSSDLLQPLSDISINSASLPSTENKDPKTDMSSKTLESLADDIIPIDTDTTSLSTHRSWARTWETSTPEQSNAEESQDAEPEGQAEDQKMVIMFERKSKENDSPWDRWTSPTVYTITGEEEEEEEEQQQEEEESPEDTQTQTVTTFRESHSEPEPAMDRYDTYSRTVTEEDRRVETPEPEAKKGFVYVKEYVNSRPDYLTSSSDSYSYGSPSTYSSDSLSSTCTYCRKPVGNDAKISIEHLNINCHPDCFKCGVCSKPMGDLLDSMFLHGGEVNCESCYSKAFE